MIGNRRATRATPLWLLARAALFQADLHIENSRPGVKSHVGSRCEIATQTLGREKSNCTTTTTTSTTNTPPLPREVLLLCVVVCVLCVLCIVCDPPFSPADLLVIRFCGRNPNMALSKNRLILLLSCVRRRARIGAENSHRRVTRSRLRVTVKETRGVPTGYLRAPYDAATFRSDEKRPNLAFNSITPPDAA